MLLLLRQLLLLYALPTSTPSRLRTTVALYAPPGPVWQRLARSAKAFPAVEVVAIISPQHGDNDAPFAGDDIEKYLAHNQTWLDGMAELRESGVKLEHYLHLRNLTCPRRGQCPHPGKGTRSWCWLPGGECARKTRCCNSIENVTSIINASITYFPEDGLFLDNGPFQQPALDSPMDTLEKIRRFEARVFALTQRGSGPGGRRVTSNGLRYGGPSHTERSRLDGLDPWVVLNLNETFMFENSDAPELVANVTPGYPRSRFSVLASGVASASQMRRVVDRFLDAGYGDICVMGVMNSSDLYQVLPDFWEDEVAYLASKSSPIGATTTTTTTTTTTMKSDDKLLPPPPHAPPGFAALLLGSTDPRGTVLRPPNFTLTAPGCGWSRWHSAGFFEYEQTFKEYGSYCLTSHYPNNTCPTSSTCNPKAAGQSAGCAGEERSAVHISHGGGAAAAAGGAHCATLPGGVKDCPTTVRLKPNRRYIAIAVVKTNFARFTTEVNLQVGMYDSSGKAINNTNAGGGLPSQTSLSPGGVGGWSRQEWEFVTPSYPDLAMGSLGVTFTFGCGNPVPELRFADYALIETPAANLAPFAVGEGLSFAGGAGALPMRVQTCTVGVLATHSARYEISPSLGTVTVSQLIDFPRALATWHVSPPSLLAGLSVRESSDRSCVLGGASLTVGVQSDGLLGFVPHASAANLTIVSVYGGDFNRLAWGHLLSEDDFGGFTVSPHAGRGSGRLPQWAVLTPGLVFPTLDRYDRNSTPHDAAGWAVSYSLVPGERIFSAVMPVRAYNWAQSFIWDWWECPHMSAGKEVTCEDMLLPSASQAATQADALVLWEAAVHANGGGWPGPYVPSPSSSAVKQLVADVHAANKSALVYMSMWFQSTRNASVYAAHVRQWQQQYKIDGVYSDGLCDDDWLVAYEEVRLLRQMFPDGPLIFHDSQEGWEEGKAAALFRPFLHAYGTSTLMGENTPGWGSHWQWPRFATAQYRHSNAFGAIKGNLWKGPGISVPTGHGSLSQNLIGLLYGGRERPISGGPDASDNEYFRARAQLQQVWQEHGQSDDAAVGGGPSSFYDQYYLPAAQNITGLYNLGRAPMPILSPPTASAGSAGDNSSSSSGHGGGPSGGHGRRGIALHTFRALRQGGEVRYTTDGTAVTPSSAVYDGRLIVPPTSSTVVRAAAFEPQLSPSRELFVSIGSAQRSGDAFQVFPGPTFRN